MYTWMVTIGFEAVAGAAITHEFIGSVEPWAWALIFMVVFTAINLATAKAFGEFEFWFSLIKVTAIVLFIGIGIAALLGVVPGVDTPGLHNVTDAFLPNGWKAVWLATAVVFFSFFGSETVTIAAGEAVDPASAVRRAMRSVVLRILIFYIGSIAVVITLLPHTDARLTNGPYVAVLDNLGIPGGQTIMSIIVLSAILSLLNSGIYAVSRIMFAAGDRGELPRAFTVVSGRGVPRLAVVVAASGGFVTVAANYFIPSDVLFTFLLSSSGSIAVVVYGFITLTQIRSRRRMSAEDVAKLPLRMWGFPYLPFLGVLASVVVALAVGEETRVSLMLSAVVTVVAFVIGAIYHKRTATSPDAGVPQSAGPQRSNMPIAVADADDQRDPSHATS